MPLTEIDTSGTPEQIGRAHGEAGRTLIHDSLARWADAIGSSGRDHDVLVEDLVRRSGFWAAVERHCPDLGEEVHGIAAGSGLSVDQVFALNCLDEGWWWGDRSTGCSTVAFVADDGGSTVAGQNMDLDTSMNGAQIVLRTSGPGVPDQVLLSSAGMVGLCGVNAAGLAIMVNTLSQLPVSTTGLPVAFVLRHALQQPTIEAACAWLESVPHASGQAYTLATRDRVVGYECGAGGWTTYVNDPELEGRRWHTNHPLVAADEAVTPDPAVDWASRSTVDRLAAVARPAATITTADQLAVVLSDGASGVCISPGRWGDSGFTFASIVVELSEDIHVRVAGGPPESTPWELFTLPRSDQQPASAAVHVAR